MRTTPSTNRPAPRLPVPRPALLELGLSDDQVDEALASAPLVVAFQADQHPDAWFDVDRAKKALRALGAFKHTKGRWAGVSMRIGEGLDPWQVVWILAPIFGWVYHDAEIDRVVRVVRSAWIEIPRKNGKALSTGTPVPTPTGWTLQGAIRPGDEVLGPDGEPTRVVAATDVMHGRTCFRVAFAGGESVVADAEHQWLATATDGEPQVCTTREVRDRIAAGEVVEVLGGELRRRVLSVSAHRSVPVRCIEVERPDGLYLVGRTRIPTHNSTLSSGISGVLLLADGEAGAEVYNAAGSTLQAGRVFDDAKRMLLTSPAARKRVEPLKEVVRVPATGGILRVLSRVAETAHGLNVSGAMVDEVHTLRLRRALVEAIETGTGARDQPLIVFITTADEAEEGTIYDEKHRYTRNVALGIVQDPGHYGVIWAAEPGDDPFVESTWRKANPGLGKSPTLAYMRREAKKAQTTPTYFPTFCRLSLNLRMREQFRWLDVAKWDGLADGTERGALARRRAWGGLDLSAVSDFTAWAVLVEADRPDADLELLTRFWVPGERVEDLERKLQVPLRRWVEQGLVVATEGDVIDYGAIKAAVIGDCRHLDMRRISYDRMFAGQMVQELDAELDGVEVATVNQTFLGLSPACKEFERLIGAGRIRHNGSPVMRWMVDVVEAKGDGNDNIRPVKPDRQKSVTRIDGVQAAVTGLDGWVRGGGLTEVDRRVFVFGR